MRFCLDTVKEDLKKAKINLFKTPITIQEDKEQLEKDGEQEVQKAVAVLEEFFRPVSEALDQVLNAEIATEVEPAQVDPKAAGAKGGVKKDDKKPAGKAAPKGAAKGELAVYESPLPTTSAGVEQLVLMLDSRLEDLPVEALQGLLEDSDYSQRLLAAHVHASSQTSRPPGCPAQQPRTGQGQLEVHRRPTGARLRSHQAVHGAGTAQAIAR